MELLTVRAYATELSKLAADIKDADIRQLRAERKGEEYLPGGRLPSNAPTETAFMPKLARQVGMSSMDPTQTPIERLGSVTKSPGAYQQGRDFAMTGVGGGLAGASVTRVLHNFRRGVPNPSHHSYRAGAAIGAGLALADRAYRHRHELGLQKTALENVPFTPAKELKAASQVGEFQESRNHTPPMNRPAGMTHSGFLPQAKDTMTDSNIVRRNLVKMAQDQAEAAVADHNSTLADSRQTLGQLFDNAAPTESANSKMVNRLFPGDYGKRSTSSPLMKLASPFADELMKVLSRR